MEIGSLKPQTFFPILGGIPATGGTRTGLFALGAQQAALRKTLSFDNYSETTNRISLDADKLLGTTSALIAGNWNAVYDKRSAISSIPAAVSVQAAENAFSSDLDITVSQTAGSKTFRTDEKTAYLSMSLPREFYDFSIRKDGNEYTFRISTDQTDTYKDVMSRIADTVNSAGIGVSANVVDGAQARSAYLEIQGIDAREMSSVTLRDVSGDIFARLGGSTKQPASGASGGYEDAVGESAFTANGKQFFGVSNTAMLYGNSQIFSNYKLNNTRSPQEIYDEWVANGGQLKDIAPQTYRSENALGQYQAAVNMTGTNTVAAEANIRPDNTAFASAVEEFISALNDTIDSLELRPAVSTFRDAVNFFGSMMASNKTGLSEAGVLKTADGYGVDTESLMSRLRTAYEEVKDLFDGAAGVAQRASFGAGKVLFFPMTAFSPLEYGVASSNKFDVSGALLNSTL